LYGEICRIGEAKSVDVVSLMSVCRVEFGGVLRDCFVVRSRTSNWGKPIKSQPKQPSKAAPPSSLSSHQETAISKQASKQQPSCGGSNDHHPHPHHHSSDRRRRPSFGSSSSSLLFCCPPLLASPFQLKKQQQQQQPSTRATTASTSVTTAEPACKPRRTMAARWNWPATVRRRWTPPRDSSTLESTVSSKRFQCRRKPVRKKIRTSFVSMEECAISSFRKL